MLIEGENEYVWYSFLVVTSKKPGFDSPLASSVYRRRYDCNHHSHRWLSAIARSSQSQIDVNADDNQQPVMSGTGV